MKCAMLRNLDFIFWGQVGYGKKFMNEIGTRANMCLGTLNLCGVDGVEKSLPPLLGSVALAVLCLLSWLGFLPLQYTQHANWA